MEHGGGSTLQHLSPSLKPRDFTRARVTALACLVKVYQTIEVQKFKNLMGTIAYGILIL
jgi:hypothetical protein